MKEEQAKNQGKAKILLKANREKDDELEKCQKDHRDELERMQQKLTEETTKAATYNKDLQM